MPNTKWSLDELIDFEVNLLRHHEDDAGDTLIRRNLIEPYLEKSSSSTRPQQKRRGFKLWLSHRSKDLSYTPSASWKAARLSVLLVLSIIAFCAGLGLIFSTLDVTNKSFNLGMLLLLTIGVQWFILIAAVFVYVSSRSHIKLLTNTLKRWITKAYGKLQPDSQLPDITRDCSTLQKPISYQLVGDLQRLSILYNVGSFIGLVIAFLFLQIGVYWESTLANDVAHYWHNLTRLLSLPWSWTGYGSISLADIQAIRSDGTHSLAGSQATQNWMSFLLLCIFVWGLIPRIILYSIAQLKLRTTLRHEPFDAPRHRKLWRRLSKHAVLNQHLNENDNAIGFDVGGNGYQVDRLRPFVLNRLRLNLENIAEVATLDQTQERKALESLKEQINPLILFCEAREFSPRSLEAFMLKIRQFQQETSIIIVPLNSSTKDLSVNSPDEQQLEPWRSWSDQLNDRNVDLVPFTTATSVES